MNHRCDFHMHTTHSDGSYTPEELLAYASEKCLRAVAVTDHDTVSGYDACKAAADKHGVELIPGIEISCQFEPGTLHVLGYFLNPKDPGLAQSLAVLQRARAERNPMIIEKLNRLGVHVTLQEVEAQSGGDQVGRPHFAQVLIKKGYARNNDEAFRKFLAKGAAAYVDKRRFSAEEGIQMIREAGGAAVVAHPKQLKVTDRSRLRQLFKEWMSFGLQGIEAYSSCQNVGEQKFWRDLGAGFGLIITGGSDFHGKNKPDVDLGWMGQGVDLGYDIVDELRAAKTVKRCS
ncbi:MAG: PHP domain-containing protein [Candidatus Omnitrophica bacterium]|nr:PHP domain-containing protein [Candidatus Omnitrophota bacterium]